MSGSNRNENGRASGSFDWEDLALSNKQIADATRAFGEKVDFGRTADDYRQHRAGFPERFFDEVHSRKWIEERKLAVDLGTGTGSIARGLAKKGLSVVAIDPAKSLLKEAAALSEAEGLTIEFVEGRAEAIVLPDNSVDIAIAGQCWHWFDRRRAADECARVIVPGGRIIIAHFDWIPLEGNIVEATEKLILQHNPEWSMGGGTGIYPVWLEDLAASGFQQIETFSFDLAQPYSSEAWRGRIRASAGIKACLDPDETRAFDESLASMMRQDFPQDEHHVHHRVWAASGVL